LMWYQCLGGQHCVRAGERRSDADFSAMNERGAR